MTATHAEPATGYDHTDATWHAAAMLKHLGITGDDDTPARLVRALHELTAGRLTDPRQHLTVQFPPVSSTPGVIVVEDVPFTSVCEHHVLPFTGHATVAYLPHPEQPIVGLSKLARLVQDYAARPQVQERLTGQVVDALLDVLQPAGAACAVRGTHSCMALRGARTGTNSAMTTVAFAGVLATDPYRREFTDRLATRAWRG
ncbi:GTP cyclohydrolase I FolE [Micromonospora sp. 15K316]|uniref:GTP cyclohydrolase I n=1 Tax=Micromonospora sp. 15K316 TaxID=2530376 RepID=UPI001048D910|nr:GTP cyclohydrolase I [Micromonospora sp. 15K316]TDC28493.1 GTP cyclohydrolase I FolE [Micromonospora sp. 15K316]